MSQRYAVVDIETTGGDPRRDKITEIGIVILEHNEIVKKYSTLVNPERSIPEFITRLTGITNAMVEDAPKFYEVAKEVVEMTNEAIFVAHNVRFDYQFLQHEFKQLGYTFSKRKLCTVRLSRQTFPGLDGYGLGKLIKYFDIKVDSRHRALDDAYAAAIVLSKALAQGKTKKSIKQMISEGIKLTRLPQHLEPKDILSLPEDCGVYYFKNPDGHIVYIGKSTNIQKRAKQHFSKESRKANRMFREVAEIDYVLTGSELHSLLLESTEIKKHIPPINVAQKQSKYPFQILSYQDENDYRRFEICKKGIMLGKDQLVFGQFSKKAHAKHRLKSICEQFQLCYDFTDIEKPKEGGCFLYEVEKCFGACLKLEEVEAYNERAALALAVFNQFLDERFIIIEETHNIDELICFIVKENTYQGYCVIDNNHAYNYYEIEEQLSHVAEENPEHQSIILQYLSTNPKVKILYP